MFYCKDVNFLMNPRALLEDLVAIIKADFSAENQFKVWRNQHDIYWGNPNLFDGHWNLIFDIKFSDKFFLRNFDSQKNFVAFNGATNVGKFFFYPIWIEVCKKSKEIFVFQFSLKKIFFKKTKISKLFPDFFFDFLGDFAKNPPKKIRDCYQEKGEVFIPDCEGESNLRCIGIWEIKK